MSKQTEDFSKRHVFISYKHEDIDFAENVQSHLQNAGFAAWMDEHIHAGDEWRVQIDQAIKSALAMIVIITPEAKASEYVTYEWSFAVGTGLKIIPVKYKQTALHPRLEAFQFLDFTTSTRPWERLIAEVRGAAQAALAAENGKSDREVLPLILQIRAGLNSTRAEARLEAIATLAQTNTLEAQDMLIEALSHPVADVRREAALALKPMCCQAALPRLIELFYDPVSGVRLAAISAVEEMEDRRRFPDAVSGMWMAASGEVEAMENCRALPVLLEILPQVSDDEKQYIVRVLSVFGDVSVIPALTTLYRQSEDIYLRMYINRTMGELRSPLAIPALRDALQDAADIVCESASSALLAIGSEEAMTMLLEALVAMNITRCEKIVSKLLIGWRETTSFIAFLSATYQQHLATGMPAVERERAARVRRRIIAIFRWRKSKEAIPTLIQSMDDEDQVVQQETVLAFKVIQDERSLPAIMTILRWRFDYYDETSLLYAIQTLAQIGNVSVIPQLKAVLNEMLDTHRELAVQVIGVFGKIGIYETLEYLRSLDARLAHAAFAAELREAIAQAIKEIRARL